MSSLGTRELDLLSSIIDRGLNNVDITDADVRTGKISIDRNGEKIIGASTQRFLERSTADATAVASDINLGKTGYSDGVKLTGTHTDMTINTAIRGLTSDYTVASDNTVTAGDFVKIISDRTIGKIASNTDTILGVAMTSGSANSTVTVFIPF